MQINVEKQPKFQAKITIELTPEELEKHRVKAAEEVSKNMNLAGFRPGKAPVGMVEEQVGPERFFNYVLEMALPETYSKAIAQEKLEIASRPKVQILSEKPLKYEVTVAIRPEVKVKDYKNIKVPEEKIEISEKDVDDLMKDFQRYHATMSAVDRPAKKGDRAEIDFEGTDLTGKPFEGGSSKNYPLIIGDNTFLEEFEKNLEGMKKAEEKTFNVTFPKDYPHEPLQGKVATFKVNLKGLEEIVLPEVTEEFLEKTLGQKMKAEDLRERMKKNLEHEKKQAGRMKREDEFLAEMLKHVEVDIPELMVEDEVYYLVEQLKGELQKKGMAFEEYLKKIKKDEKTIQEELKKEAEKRLRMRLGLEYLFAEEKIEVTDEDVQKEIAAMAQNYPESEQEKVIKEYMNPEARSQLKNRLMLYHLFEKLVHTKGKSE